MILKPRTWTWIVVALVLGLTVATWREIVVGSADHSKSSGKKSHIHFTSTERNSAQKLGRASVDTRELRREATEILGRLEPLSNVMDILADAARLSAIFRQWGEIDFEEAKRFLETEESAKKMQNPDRTFADDLLLAALIGFSKTDPVRAWDIFLTTQDKEQSRGVLGLASGTLTHEVAAEQIMRALFAKSQEVALEMVRHLDSTHSFLIAPSLRAIMSLSDDAEFRSEIFKEFYESDSNADRSRAGLVCAGIAERDPQMAREFLDKAAKGLVIDFDPDVILGFEFIGNLARRQPEDSLRYISEFKRDEDQDEAQTLLLLSFICAQYPYHPELVVEALEMDSLKRFQENFFSNENQSLEVFDIPWPLIDENVPLSREIHLERFKQAVESSELLDRLKEQLLEAIEAEQGK